MTEDKEILIQNIYYMLSYAFQELRRNNYKDIEGEKFDNVHDLFAEILAKGTACQLKQGLHREYVSRRESLTTLKGKIDIGGTIRNRMRRTTELSCDHDELSADCTFNQILKTTMELLVRATDVNAKRRGKLKNLLFFFSEVSTIDVSSIKWTTLRFDRNTHTYRMLIYICYFVIQNYLLTTTDGRTRMQGFTDEHISRLYEKFILEYYRKHHPELRPRAAQIDWNIIAEASSTDVLPIMQTDVMLSFPNRTLIIDAKYYGHTMQHNFGKASIHSGNLYQIESYVLNADRQHTGTVDGLLLYAKTGERLTPDGQIILVDGNVISFKTLNLNQPFCKIAERLEQIVGSVG